mgnify:CR=1 FL=1
MAELRFGLTAPSPCSYLGQQHEQLVFLLAEQPISASLYQQLLQINFRRSGEQVYTPHCPSCQACQSVRINPQTFALSKSQRRLLNKAKRRQWHYRLAEQPQDYFELYSRYIKHKHADGTMYPPDQAHLDAMLSCSWLKVGFLEQYCDNQLVAVTVVDVTEQALSAVYTFYEPDGAGRKNSYGNYGVLWQIEQAAKLNLPYVYLGYWISDSPKMSYKAAFKPHELRVDGEWQTVAS